MPSVSISSTSQNFTRGRSSVVFTNTVARTDTVAKDLFTLQPGDIPIGLWVTSPAASNASVGASLSIGSTSNATYFVAGLDVKSTALTSGGGGFSIPSSTGHLGETVTYVTPVQATYSEVGNASTAGGPWAIYMEVLPGS